MVVHAVGEHEAVGIAPEEFFGRRIVKRPALVDKAVMHNAVKHAVNRKAKRDIPQRRRPEASGNKQASCDNAKPNAV